MICPYVDVDVIDMSMLDSYYHYFYYTLPIDMQCQMEKAVDVYCSCESLAVEGAGGKAGQLDEEERDQTHLNLVIDLCSQDIHQY